MVGGGEPSKAGRAAVVGRELHRYCLKPLLAAAVVGVAFVYGNGLVVGVTERVGSSRSLGVEGHHDFPQPDLGNVEALVKHGSEGAEVARGFLASRFDTRLDRCLIWLPSLSFGVSRGGYLTFVALTRGAACTFLRTWVSSMVKV